MSDERFEETPVWQASIDLARRVLRVTSHPSMAGHPEFIRQLETAVLGVGNHIVAGSCSQRAGRRPAELDEARVCAAKVRSMLWLLDSGVEKRPGSKEIGKMKVLADRVEKYLASWLTSLKGDPTRRPKARRSPGDALKALGDAGGAPSDSARPDDASLEQALAEMAVLAGHLNSFSDPPPTGT